MRPLRRPAPFLLIAAFGALAIACSTVPTDPVALVTARSTADGIVLTNGTSRTIYYDVPVNLTAAAYTDWLPCQRLPSGCPTVNASASVVIPWTATIGQGMAGDYVMPWWWAGADTSYSIRFRR